MESLLGSDIQDGHRYVYVADRFPDGIFGMFLFLAEPQDNYVLIAGGISLDL
jgi:hypothetical protein